MVGECDDKRVVTIDECVVDRKVSGETRCGEITAGVGEKMATLMYNTES